MLRILGIRGTIPLAIVIFFQCANKSSFFFALFSSTTHYSHDLTQSFVYSQVLLRRVLPSEDVLSFRTEELLVSFTMKTVKLAKLKSRQSISLLNI